VSRKATEHTEPTLEEQAAHERGRRVLLVGDVLQEVRWGAIASVVATKRPSGGLLVWSWSATSGTALLQWERERVSRILCRRCLRYRLVEKGEGLETVVVHENNHTIKYLPGAEPALHAAGWRRVREGDVLVHAWREALVVETDTSTTRLSWLDTGRSSIRATHTLRRLTLARAAK
jgi:hypothetical protein